MRILELMHEALVKGLIITKRLVYGENNCALGWILFIVLLFSLFFGTLVLMDGNRDMFYKDPKLFIRQGVVDQYVDDIACTFGVQRHCLNVVRHLPICIEVPLTF